jgi:hypothetical protein
MIMEEAAPLTYRAIPSIVEFALKRASALGIKLPQSLLLRANEVLH